MPINVSEAIDSDTGSIVTLEDNTGAYADGIFQAGTPSTRVAIGSMQSPSSAQLEYLEGSERKASDIRAVYLNKEVQLSKDNDMSTIIIYKGDRFKVVHVGNWQPNGWFFAMAAKL